MNKVGLLYICTGKYEIFWESFYNSSEKFLLPNCQKMYFVFSDAKRIYNEDNDTVRKVSQKNLGWPRNTLMRFNMFRKIEEELKEYDYLFFFNANMLLVDIVYEEEILPKKEGLMAVIHPGFYNKKENAFSYDRNPNSQAYIPYGQGKYYFMGGLNGGRSHDYLKLIKTLDGRIKKDLANGVTAIWHDESHLNKYLLGKTIKILNPSYGYPEGWNLPFTPKIIIRDKKKWGGHAFLRHN
ncbi:family 6 glucosyltransferase [Alkalihalobacillus sp. BA299]|uniref:family 6 glucosyltransferase n=1 Tax=Alkalihalobacillus sp. BA299 TaxID=2815938 RepID=UPI001ADA3076|nr:family 6 glucosyltransferase [Alkalihalobacillus sp. BA299]